MQVKTDTAEFFSQKTSNVSVEQTFCNDSLFDVQGEPAESQH